MEEKNNVRFITLTVEIQYTGTLEEAKTFADELDDTVTDHINREIYCGEPECCGPVAPLSGHVSFALASRTIGTERETSSHCEES